MPCTKPIPCWRAKKPNENGKYPIVFNPKDAQLDADMKISCGRCLHCRMQKQRDWALRCSHEKLYHERSGFLTLTYDDEHLPKYGNLERSHHVKFLKAYRNAIYPQKIRYFGCGEYGDKRPCNPINPLTGEFDIGRPHFHYLIFGHEFTDLEPWAKKGDNMTYTSPTLDKIWGKGRAIIGTVTNDSANYVAQYTAKKINKQNAENHYNVLINPKTGEFFSRQPEFPLVSTHPGSMGYQWFNDYHNDLWKGFITYKGNKMPIPEYYLKLALKMDDQSLFLHLMELRRGQFDTNDPERSRERLDVKNEVLRRKIERKNNHSL